MLIAAVCGTTGWIQHASRSSKKVDLRNPQLHAKMATGAPMTAKEAQEEAAATVAAAETQKIAAVEAAEAESEGGEGGEAAAGGTEE